MIGKYEYPNIVTIIPHVRSSLGCSAGAWQIGAEEDQGRDPKASSLNREKGVPSNSCANEGYLLWGVCKRDTFFLGEGVFVLIEISCFLGFLVSRRVWISVPRVTLQWKFVDESSSALQHHGNDESCVRSYSAQFGGAGLREVGAYGF